MILTLQAVRRTWNIRFLTINAEGVEIKEER